MNDHTYLYQDQITLQQVAKYLRDVKQKYVKLLSTQPKEEAEQLLKEHEVLIDKLETGKKLEDVEIVVLKMVLKNLINLKNATHTNSDNTRGIEKLLNGLD